MSKPSLGKSEFSNTPYVQLILLGLSIDVLCPSRLFPSSKDISLKKYFLISDHFTHKFILLSLSLTPFLLLAFSLKEEMCSCCCWGGVSTNHSSLLSLPYICKSNRSFYDLPLRPPVSSGELFLLRKFGLLLDTC